MATWTIEHNIGQNTNFEQHNFEHQTKENPEQNPCLSCGACCAYFRVSFYWAEGDDVEGGTVPVALTTRVGPWLRAMRGTEQVPPRCVALEGEIGRCVRCAIYERRPSVCREFAVSGQDGRRNELCDRARQAWGLPPLGEAGEQVPPASEALPTYPWRPPDRDPVPQSVGFTPPTPPRPVAA
jgi:Fe-S-cluster containining protein